MTTAPATQSDERKRATPGQIKDYFSEGTRKVTLQELKDLKADPKDYDAIAFGIGDGSLNY